MLKVLKLRSQIKAKRAKLVELKKRKATNSEKSTEIETALEEAKEDEDFKLLEEEIETLSKDIEVVDGEIETLETEIADLETEVDESEERQKKATDQKRGASKTRSNDDLKGDGLVTRKHVRELLRSGEYFERSEVKEFYEKLKNIRSVEGGELTVPQIVIDRIMAIVGDFTTLYPLVDKIKVSGTARILIDTDTTAATWIEKGSAIPEANAGTITYLDFDGFKVGRVVLVDNALLQDSIINIDDYVSKKVARSIGIALDVSILNGTGATNKQPDGIIPKLTAAQKVTVEVTGWADVVKPIGKIDSGADATSEIIAVMKRSTYYNRLLDYSIHANSAGDDVGKLPNLKNPDLLGLRVVFNNGMDEDKVLFGEFNKYTLVERESITIDKSTEVKFIEDQTAFRGKGRFDGKPTNIGSFVLVTMTDPA